MSTQYVGRYLHDVVDAINAATVAGVHCIIISKDPGWGKTDIALAAAQRIAGEGHYSFTRIDPSTPMAVVKGTYDPAKMVNDGELVLLREGTPYDPNNRIVILDEISRGTDAMFDVILDVADRRDIPASEAPVVIGTANFMITSERSAPMRDRFSLWVWMTPSIDDVEPYVDAMRGLNATMDIPGEFPSWDEVEQVRSYEVGDNAHRAISAFIQMLATEAMAQGFKLNPRRLRQWYNLLYRYSAWLTGDADFEVVPDQAKNLMKYAWPTPQYEEHTKWANVAGKLVNIVRSAILATLAEAKEHFERMENDLKSGRKERTEEAVLFGKVQQTALDNLSAFGNNLPEVKEAKIILTKMFKAAVNGSSLDSVMKDAAKTLKVG